MLVRREPTGPLQTTEVLSLEAFRGLDQEVCVGVWRGDRDEVRPVRLQSGVGVEVVVGSRTPRLMSQGPLPVVRAPGEGEVDRSKGEFFMKDPG